ncbi:MAG: hypothetical protein HYR94_28175 [Chloroflexi bacterium]|nr:hypothetical protein [Chloroflexota bacterium]
MDAEKWDRINERIKARHFELGACLPVSWKSVSLDLKHAADRLYDLYHDATLRIIEQSLEEIKEGEKTEDSRALEGKELEDFLDSQLISKYFLLMGYAIENLLKGILMIQHPEYFKPNAKITDIRSHNLVNLCKRCKISLRQEEADLLNKLTRHIEWQGKYPIPLESDKMFPIKESNSTWEIRGEAFDGRQTQQEFDNLYAKIWNELEHHIASSYHQTSSD